MNSFVRLLTAGVFLGYSGTFAEPIFLLRTTNLPEPTRAEQAFSTGGPAFQSWELSVAADIWSAEDAYVNAHSTCIESIESVINDFVATATYNIDPEVTDPVDVVYFSAEPKWFTELPPEVQAEKLQESDDLNGIVASMIKEADDALVTTPSYGYSSFTEPTASYPVPTESFQSFKKREPTTPPAISTTTATETQSNLTSYTTPPPSKGAGARAAVALGPLGLAGVIAGLAML